MTPAFGWTELDYYRASRHARRLGESRLAQQQIQGVLDEADRGEPVGLVEPAVNPTSSRGGLEPPHNATALAGASVPGDACEGQEVTAYPCSHPTT